jgi:aspartyl-tRNA(Asn)/glutamyl-tRNA(Gln) amidotransferase subunit C
MARMAAPDVSITRDDVAHLARLARIAMTADELDHLAGQLDVILAAVARVQEVAADDIAPTSHAVPLTNVFRADEPAPSLGPDAALAAAPAAEGGRFRVPQILEDPAGEDAALGDLQ